MLKVSSAGLLFLLAGCGSSGLQVLAPPARGFSKFGRAEIRDVKVELRHSLTEGWKSEAWRDTGPLRSDLYQRLIGRGLFQGGGPPITIEIRIVRFDPEWSEPTLQGGRGGVWSVSITLDVRFFDAQGSLISRVECDGLSETRGVVTATAAEAHVEALRSLLNFIDEHR